MFSTIDVAALDRLASLKKSDSMPVLFVGPWQPHECHWGQRIPAQLAGTGCPIWHETAQAAADFVYLGTLADRRLVAHRHGQPKTIHDFGGFPQELFDQQYPAPGDPAAARAISVLVRQRGSRPLGLDLSEWGLDHGAWSVLKPMFPDADIPVIQLSMDYGRAPGDHYALARQLKALRDRGVLIVGSGNIVHNLRQMQRGAAGESGLRLGAGV